MLDSGYAECRNYVIVVHSVIMLSVLMLSAVEPYFIYHSALSLPTFYILT
jgi:hypothetical protein